MARQFNQIPPICEQAEYHMFQREKVEVQLPELFHKIGVQKLIPVFVKSHELLLIFYVVPICGRICRNTRILMLVPSVLRCGGHDMVATGLWDHLREI